MATILLDIGNVLWSDDDGDAFTLTNIGRVLAARGQAVSEGVIAAAQAQAVADWAPSAWRAVIHGLARDPVEAAAVTREVRARWDALSDDDYAAFTTPFPSTAPLLESLAEGGHTLVLASNNSPRALARLETLGLLRHFAVKEVSETLDLAKPDPRFFEALLAAAGNPARAIMVGDRIDNDVAPARALGLATVRLRHGSHIAQEPRGPESTPDLTVDDPAELSVALARFVGV
ncbi:MAG: HAD family hydrolase [Candidatus Latescibacteria bacterium]|nr:HAD family hydrolase [Candidatus Latescibacterota bacterium]